MSCRENLEQQQLDTKALQNEVNASKRALEPKVGTRGACVEASGSVSSP